MTEARRDTLKQKVAVAKARNVARTERTLLERAGDTAVDAKNKFTSFAKEHPVATVAGGLVIGVLISALFKKSPTRRLGGKAAGLAAIGAELAMSYVARSIRAAGDVGGQGVDRLGDLGTSVGQGAKSVGSSAAGYAASARGALVDTAKAIRGRLN